MPYYGLLTNPSNEILGEISKIYDLDFEYVEVGIEGPEGNPLIVDNHGNRDEHLSIGAGLIDHQKAFEVLKNVNYDSTITLEVFTNSNDAKSSADKLRMICANGYYTKQI